MSCRIRIAVALMAVGLFLALSGNIIKANDHELVFKPKHVKSTQATPHTERQAGYPYCVSEISMESYNEHYSGGFVGGGSAFSGHGRCSNEGTWGWDYTPFRAMSPRIFLNWSHGRRYQGGTGAYATDGPKPLEHLTESIHEHFGSER